MAVTPAMVVVRMAMRLALRIVAGLAWDLDEGGWEFEEHECFASVVDMMDW